MNIFKSTFILNPPTLLIFFALILLSACKKEATKPSTNSSTENSLTTPETYYNLKMLSVGLQGANNLVNQWNANQKKENSISLAHIIYRECAKGFRWFLVLHLTNV